MQMDDGNLGARGFSDFPFGVLSRYPKMRRALGGASVGRVPAETSTNHSLVDVFRVSS